MSGKSDSLEENVGGCQCPKQNPHRQQSPSAQYIGKSRSTRRKLDNQKQRRPKHVSQEVLGEEFLVPRPPWSVLLIVTFMRARNQSRALKN